MDLSSLASSLSSDLIFLFGLVLVLLAEGIKQVSKRWNVKFDKFWISVVLFIMASGMALVFYPFIWPILTGNTFTDIILWLRAVLPVVFAIIGVAVILYNLIVSRIKKYIDAYLNEPLETIDLSGLQ